MVSEHKVLMTVISVKQSAKAYVAVVLPGERGGKDLTNAFGTGLVRCTVLHTSHSQACCYVRWRSRSRASTCCSEHQVRPFTFSRGAPWHCCPRRASWQIPGARHQHWPGRLQHPATSGTQSGELEAVPSVLVHSVPMQRMVQAGVHLARPRSCPSCRLDCAASCKNKQVCGLIQRTQQAGRTGRLSLSGFQSKATACSAPTTPSIPDFVRFDRACCPLLFNQTAFK